MGVLLLRILIAWRHLPIKHRAAVPVLQTVARRGRRPEPTALAVGEFDTHHAHDVPFFRKMVEGGTEKWFRFGWVKVPDWPRFGVELHPAVGKRYRVPGTRWFDEA